MPVTHNGATWTTKEETLEFSSLFEERYKYHGDPYCHLEPRSKAGQPCGATTAYIIEPCELEILNVGTPQEKRQYRPKHRGVAAVLMLRSGGPADFIYHEGNLYIPMKICLRCSALGDGWHDGIAGKSKRSYDSMRQSMPEADAEAFQSIYNAAYSKARKIYDEAAEKRAAKKNKARYAEI